jgi:hypothetical protein
MTAPASSVVKAYCLGALLAASAHLLTACTSVDSDDATPSTDAQAAPSIDVQTPPSPISFESERHSYRLELPTGWEVAEYGGTWTSFEEFVPGGEVPGEDVASSPGGTGFLVANSMEIADETSSAAWLGELERLVRTGLGPECQLTTDTVVLAGERATIARHRCEGMTVVGRSLTHADRGYYFTIGFPTGDTATATTLDGIVSSIRFVDP